MFLDLALNCSDPKSAVLELNFLHARLSLVKGKKGKAIPVTGREGP
jgi:hypothetical protein